MHDFLVNWLREKVGFWKPMSTLTLTEPCTYLLLTFVDILWSTYHLLHIGANLIPDSVFKPMWKNQNDDNDYLRLFSIVFFAVESDSGVKWSLKFVQGPKKEDLEA